MTTRRTKISFWVFFSNTCSTFVTNRVRLYSPISPHNSIIFDWWGMSCQPQGMCWIPLKSMHFIVRSFPVSYTRMTLLGIFFLIYSGGWEYLWRRRHRKHGHSDDLDFIILLYLMYSINLNQSIYSFFFFFKSWVHIQIRLCFFPGLTPFSVLLFSTINHLQYYTSRSFIFLFNFF